MVKLKKIFIIFIVVIILFGSINISYGSLLGDVFGDAKTWIQKGKDESNDEIWSDGGKTAGIKNGFNDLAGALWTVGIFVLVIMIMAMGISYIFASVENKAQIKERYMPILIAAFIIIGALSIWKLAITFLEGVIS